MVHKIDFTNFYEKSFLIKRRFIFEVLALVPLIGLGLAAWRRLPIFSSFQFHFSFIGFGAVLALLTLIWRFFVYRRLNLKKGVFFSHKYLIVDTPSGTIRTLYHSIREISISGHRVQFTLSNKAFVSIVDDVNGFKEALIARGLPFDETSKLKKIAGFLLTGIAIFTLIFLVYLQEPVVEFSGLIKLGELLGAVFIVFFMWIYLKKEVNPLGDELSINILMNILALGLIVVGLIPKGLSNRIELIVYSSFQEPKYLRQSQQFCSRASRNATPELMSLCSRFFLNAPRGESRDLAKGFYLARHATQKSRNSIKKKINASLLACAYMGLHQRQKAYYLMEKFSINSNVLSRCGRFHSSHEIFWRSLQ